MYTFHYGLSDCLKQYGSLINNHSIFPFIAVAIILLGLLIFINRTNRKSDIIFTVINLFFIIILIYAYGRSTILNIDTFFKGNPLKNMYFYFFNNFIIILLIDRLLSTNRTDKEVKTIAILFYIIVIINLLFSLYIANDLGFSSILVIGNIYPMVLLGNIINIIFYLFIVGYYIVKKIYRYYCKKKHLMY